MYKLRNDVTLGIKWEEFVLTEKREFISICPETHSQPQFFIFFIIIIIIFLLVFFFILGNTLLVSGKCSHVHFM